MAWQALNIIVEGSGAGYLLRRLHGAYCDLTQPQYSFFKALALKSGLPGSEVFKFTTGGQEVTLVPMGQHLDQHGGDEIVDLSSLRWDFEKPDGKIAWIRQHRLIKGQYLSEFVDEGPVRIHYLPEAKCLAIGGGRNRLLTLMRLGYRNLAQLKEASWDEENEKYANGDVAINSPGKPVWDDIPPDTTRQGWVDKTTRWADAWRQGLRLTLGEVYEAVFR